MKKSDKDSLEGVVFPIETPPSLSLLITKQKIEASIQDMTLMIG
jgi:hypothetical protein